MDFVCEKAKATPFDLYLHQKDTRRGWESNPRIAVLQTAALPLGHRAILLSYQKPAHIGNPDDSDALACARIAMKLNEKGNLRIHLKNSKIL